MTAPFDGNDYRKRVLARLLADNAAADPETGDPFLVGDVSPDAGDEQIRKRLDEVVAFWQKERNHPRYKGIAALLVSRKDAYAAVLLDPVARAAALQRVHGVREQGRRAALAELDRLAAALTARYHGIPRSRVPRLEQAATRRGIDAAGFAAWLAGQQVVDTGEDASVLPWESGVRRQVRAALDELASLAGERDRYRTLWTFLGLPADSTASAVAERYDTLLGRNQAGRHDRARTLTGDLLGHVKTRLMIDGGAAAYAASIRADARDAIAGEIEELGLVAGELSAADVAALTARIVGWSWGVAAAEARDIVTAAAGTLGIAVAVGGEVDLVVCARCRNPQQAPPDGRCRYCGAELFIACPVCTRRIEAAAEICPHCHTDLAAFHQQLAAAARGSELLAAGQPAAALAVVSEAGENAGPRPPAALADAWDEARRAVALARESWTTLTADLQARRLWAAAAAVEILSTRASDVPGPDGRTAADWLTELRGRQDRARAATAQAAALDPAQAEPALDAVLREAADAPEALSALARLPLAPAAELLARVGTDSVELSWLRPAGYPRGSFRIRRIVDGSRTALGSTGVTSFSDASVPSGRPVKYEVVHSIGERRSPPAVSDEVLVLRDVAAARAETSDGSIVVTWPPVAGAGHPVIERSVDDPAITAPTRRIRPSEAGRYVDPDPAPNVRYRYRVFIEYDLPDGVRATPGASVTATRLAPPAAVSELWIDQGADGVVVVGYPRVASGEVLLLASDGPSAVPFGTPGQRLDQAELDRRLAAPGIRVIARGARRGRDGAARGRVVYTAVTSNGSTAVVGAAAEHVAVPRITGLVAREVGDGVLLDWVWPHGVTEATVLWRNGAPPSGPDDRQASGLRVTNTRMQIDGGCLVPARPAGSPLHVAVYPLVRLTQGGQPVAVASAAARLRVG